jgi:DNA-binding NtrC family response regulator
VVVAAVLVVEDEVQVLVMVNSILADAGYQTLTAGTFAEAMAIIQSDKEIDLLFTDLTLFGEIEGGLQLGRAFAETRPQRPVLYTTARGITDGTIEMFVKPYGFVAKPYTPENVLTAIKNLLDTS